MKYTFPADKYGTNTLLVPIDEALIPLIAGRLGIFFLQSYWKTSEDYELGYNAFAELLANMSGNTLNELIEAVNRLYRLHDTALNGVQYAELAGEISPPIPSVPPASVTAANAMRAHIGRLWTLAENAHSGATFSAGAGIEGAPALPVDLAWAQRLLALQGVTGGFLGIGEQPVQLKDLLKQNRLNTQGDKTSLTDAIQTVTSTVNAGGTLADAIGEYLGTAAELGTDGGVIAVQLASTAALLLQLQRINVALNGNPLVSTGTPSLLFALRGDELITSDNNILSQLKVAAERISDGSGPPIASYLQNIDLQTFSLYDIRTALRQLAGQEAAGQLAAGSVAALQLAVLECICEGVSGTPTGPTWPDPAEYACGALDTYVLYGDVTWDASGQGAVTWVEQPGAAGALVAAAFGGAGFRTLTNGRQLCFSLVWPDGSTPPAAGAGGNFNPYLISDPDAPGARPSLTWNGGIRQTEGDFWGSDPSEGGEIGYRLALSLSSGTTDLAARIYVYAGPVG